MRSTDYPRASRAVFCSVLLLSQHAVVDANAWATGRSSRSSTLAVAAPGGRDRPVRDWKAISRDAGKQLEERKKEAAAPKVEEAVEAVEEVRPEVVNSPNDVSDSLELEKGAPRDLAIMLGQLAVMATVGVYSAKKVVQFAKAFIKARKESSSGAMEDASAVATTEGETEKEEEAVDEAAAEEGAVVVDDADDDEDDGGDDEVTNLSSTADQDEQEQESDQPQRETVLSTAMEDVQTRHEGELESSAGDEKEGEGGGEEGEEEGSEEGTGGDAPGVKYSEGKGDVTYV
eukprot:jgi/Undpi1/9006/HiC_scaffold_26.g11467.m1